MNSIRFAAIKILGALSAALLLVPSFAAAQAGGGAGGRGGAGGGMGVAQQLQQVLGQLDLTSDQETKIKGIMKDAQQSMRESLQGLQDATQDERQAKMQDVQKLMTDTLDKVTGEMTPEQKAKFYPLMAKAALKRATELVAAIKAAATKMKIGDDEMKQLNTALDDTDKTLDGYKPDADAVSDAAGSKDFTQKLTRSQLNLRKQVVDILGQEDGQKLMQDARQAMRPGLGGGAGADRKDKGDSSATTEPAVK
jgi:Spy/CpxP family protein refolding chaperone